ncbi:MAG: DUF1476 domain-containing protein [Alphaproteobacteria bacterium]
MTDAFEEREKGFEAKYRIDTELAFRTAIRRDKLFGRWAAEALGLKGTRADAYVEQLVALAIDTPGDDALIASVLHDLQERSVDMTDGRLRIKLDKLHTEAREQVEAEAAERRRRS